MASYSADELDVCNEIETTITLQILAHGAALPKAGMRLIT